MPGNWERFGQLNLNIRCKTNKVLFIWYQYNGNTAGGVSVQFKIMVDEVEVKTGRS